MLSVSTRFVAFTVFSALLFRGNVFLLFSLFLLFCAYLVLLPAYVFFVLCHNPFLFAVGRQRFCYGQWSKGDILLAFLVKRGYRPNTAAGGARMYPRLPQIQF